MYASPKHAESNLKDNTLHRIKAQKTIRLLSIVYIFIQQKPYPAKQKAADFSNVKSAALVVSKH